MWLLSRVLLLLLPAPPHELHMRVSAPELRHQQPAAGSPGLSRRQHEYLLVIKSTLDRSIYRDPGRSCRPVPCVRDLHNVQKVLIINYQKTTIRVKYCDLLLFTPFYWIRTGNNLRQYYKNITWRETKPKEQPMNNTTGLYIKSTLVSLYCLILHT